MTTPQSSHDSYEFTYTDIYGKTFSLSYTHDGHQRELEEFFLIAARMAGFHWAGKVYLVPEFGKDFSDNDSTESD